MILRKPSPEVEPNALDWGAFAGDTYDGWGKQASLRWRVAMLTASMVAIAVGVMTVLAYWSVSVTLTNSVDKDLQAKANALLSQTVDPSFFNNVKSEVDYFRAYNADTRISIRLPGWNFTAGDDLPLLALPKGEKTAVATVNGDRVFRATNDAGATVILSRDMTDTQDLIITLGLALLTFGGLGILLSIMTGIVVASAGLRPLVRLQSAVDQVTKTQKLTPIPVVGNDELALLTVSFNQMLAALDQSRQRQAQLVADAGHELKTPLTSMRTNIELLMLMQKPGAPQISDAEKKALEHDVMAQMEELSTLIGDLVDLAREDAPERELEETDLAEVAQTALERVRRRRPDVEFRLNTMPWYMWGDSHSLGRAILNLMDNAAKWSPADGVVRIDMQRISEDKVQITVSDSGPGIPVEDREKVFERFYRSIQARSMPGSGLGLAIVQQVVERHGGTIAAEESDDGGAMFRLIMPGYEHPEDLVLAPKKPSKDQFIANAHESRPKQGRATMFRNAHDSIEN
ncbi:signal transduction histidine kinase [Corynebacterium mustelae]|uniref:histidine kinase n=1 Tax=Corynebacterium mustelae TaxID=571915 RepID=A0A0G3GVX6_9CORY|nr:signal transduction histidine kinase [Corynebacterium mustelae]